MAADGAAGAGGAAKKGVLAAATATVATAEAHARAEEVEDESTREELAKLLFFGSRYKKQKERSEKKEHKFWKTQPVPQEAGAAETGGGAAAGGGAAGGGGEAAAGAAGAAEAAGGGGEEEEEEDNVPIEVKTLDSVSRDPQRLPAGFTWASVDVTSAAELTEVFELLAGNYVEDDDEHFRFLYSTDFLRWALTPPGYTREWHVGVRNPAGKLYGFIAGIPVQVVVRGKKVRMCEINYLCVHRLLRSKRLAPVLIREVTRRVNLTDVWQAVYTAGVNIPTPVSSARYWHRALDIRKLVEVGFSGLGPRQTMARMERIYRLPSEPAHGWRPMARDDVPSVTRLVNAYLERFDLHFEFSPEEVAHIFLPQDEVIASYVLPKRADARVVDPRLADAVAKSSVSDFLSFFYLPSQITKDGKHRLLRAVYSYYNVPATMTLTDLFKDALVLGKARGNDVFNALALMENAPCLTDTKFAPGDGDLKYYLYNWRTASVPADKLGIVLV